MFLFVFYFQGPQGQSPIMAGLELAPLAIAMLISSPLAGVFADRHGSRGLAALGMVVSAAGLIETRRDGRFFFYRPAILQFDGEFPHLTRLLRDLV